MSDVHVLVCSDFYFKSALGEMWVKCIKCTGWSQLACSDGSDLYVWHLPGLKHCYCDLQCHCTLVQSHEFFCILAVTEMVYCIDCVLKPFVHALFLTWMCLQLENYACWQKQHFKCECLAPCHSVWLLIYLRLFCIWNGRFIPAIMACLRSSNRLPHCV